MINQQTLGQNVVFFGATAALGRRPRQRAVFAAACLSFLLAACSSDTSKKVLSDGCVLSSDCSSGLTCTFGRCHTPCVTSKDCPIGASCVKANDGTSVCELPAEASCVNSSGCPAPLVCGVDQNCRGGCQQGSDCTSGQKCTNQKVCAEPTQVDANNNLILGSDAGVGGAGGSNSSSAGATSGGSKPTGGLASIGGNSSAGATSAGGAALGGSTSLGGSTNTGGTTAGGSASIGGGSTAGGTAVGGTTFGGSTSVGGSSHSGGAAVGGSASIGGNTAAGAPSAGGSSALASNGGNGNGGSGTGGQSGNACPSAQTQFGNVAQGDSNANFVSGVGVRASSSLLIFSSYRGPDPSGIADAGTVNWVYVQEFDVATGKSKGPAKPFFAANPSDAHNATLQAAAVAPTGQIALLYQSVGAGLKAAFLDTVTDADAGPAGLQVQQTVPLEVSSLNSQPQAFWSVASGCFVFSWNYSGNRTIKVRKFLPDGHGAGGDTDEVPTNNTSDVTSAYYSGAVAGSGKMFGVAYNDSSGNLPYFTVLDRLGNEVGTPFKLASGGSTWITAAGTSAGFVTFYDQGGVGETFIPVGADGSVAASQPVDAGALSGFHFNGTKVAVYGRALNDDVGGIGGVGVALLYQDGVAFSYVNTDGLTHTGVGSVIAHTYTSGDYVNISNYGGSFGVSLYSAADHSTQMAATGCSP